ncbi:MAG: ribose-phosphate pyrophosphokinase [Phycisphaeraceae bacterium]|nr:MAG: ribose-phosphate pyrophosphokinase [Phycisphaeraceae bacterium]
MAWDDVNGLKVFAGRNSIDLTQRICNHLGIPLGYARTELFPDGELIVHVEEDVRGRDCFVVLGTSEPVNSNLVELLIFADSLRRASARRITAVMPYFGYARQDRKERGRTPITAKLVANLITTAGYSRVLVLDLHAAQIQGFFDLPVDHLAAGAIFLQHFNSMRDELDDLVVVSPDVGNVKIAQSYADRLGADLAIVYKKRHSGTVVDAETIIGTVKGRNVLMVDDMISTGGTICEAATLVREHGAKRIIVAATHAVMAGEAVQRLSAAPIDEIVITNTIPVTDDRVGPIRDRLTVLCVSQLIADAIDHIHQNKSVSALFKRFSESKR